MSARCGALAPCPCCHRHVRVCTASCPFCGTTLSVDFGSDAVPDTRTRLHRAAIFVFASTVGAAAAAATACGARTGLPVSDANDATPETPDGELADVAAPDSVDVGPDTGEARDTGSWAGPYKAAPFGP